MAIDIQDFCDPRLLCVACALRLVGGHDGTMRAVHVVPIPAGLVQAAADNEGAGTSTPVAEAVTLSVGCVHARTGDLAALPAPAASMARAALVPYRWRCPRTWLLVCCGWVC